MATTGLRNLKVKIPMNRSQGSRGQTKDSSKKRHLGRLHNNNSGLEMELV